MLHDSYGELDAADKIQLIAVVNNLILYRLIDCEIRSVRDQMCGLVIEPGFEIKYAIAQQRLISLQDLRLFLERVKEETTPQSNTE